MNRHRIHETTRARTVVAGCLGLAFLAATLPAQIYEVGLSVVGAQRFENEDLLFYEPETNDRFAFTLATGDFNGDGADDLATGMPYDDCLAGFGPINCGSVVIRYGVPGAGLETGLADHILNQQTSGSPDQAEEQDRFGWALAACDMNRDYYDDLAVGIPFEDHPGAESAGAIQVYYGSSVGLSTGGIAFYSQNSSGIPGSAEQHDNFGYALACGDFNRDGFDDLVIGVPGETSGTILPETQAGLVIFLPGSAVGARPDLSHSLDQDSSGMDGSNENYDFFGTTLAAGDFNGDLHADVAIGVPEENGTGAVHMVWGSASGITTAGNFLFFESWLGGTPEPGDDFGQALAVGDFDGDLYYDLAIGVPFEGLGASTTTGSVGVVYGSVSGLNFNRSQLLDQDSLLGAGNSASGDRFGFALASGDFDRDRRDDLAIGHPGENYSGADDGAVTVIMGAAGAGLSPARVSFLASGYFGIPGNPFEHSKQFGYSLAAGNFDGDGNGDLAIGMPYANVGGITDVGAEIVLYGSLFADNFETGDYWVWSSVATP